jgi:arylsulfatase
MTFGVRTKPRHTWRWADSAPDIAGKSYSITAEVDIPPGGAEGMINTLGGRGGGHGLYLLKGKPVFVYNFFDLERFRWEGPAALTPGKHTIVFDFKMRRPRFRQGRHRRAVSGR